MLSPIQTAIAAIKSAPRSLNGGVYWMADPTLMAKVAVAIIGSGDTLAAMKEITDATGVNSPTMRLFIRGRDAQQKPCQVILDGLKAAGLMPVAYTPRHGGWYGRKSISAAGAYTKPIAATSQPEPSTKRSVRDPAAPLTEQEKQDFDKQEDYLVEGWSLKELRDALDRTRTTCEEAKDVLIQRTRDMVDSCESYAQVFNEVAGQWGLSGDTDPFSVIVKTGPQCMEVINLSIVTNRAVADWNKAIKHHRELLENYKVLRASRWPFLPPILY